MAQLLASVLQSQCTQLDLSPWGVVMTGLIPQNEGVAVAIVLYATVLDNLTFRAAYAKINGQSVAECRAVLDQARMSSQISAGRFKRAIISLLVVSSNSRIQDECRFHLQSNW